MTDQIFYEILWSWPSTPISNITCDTETDAFDFISGLTIARDLFGEDNEPFWWIVRECTLEKGVVKKLHYNDELFPGPFTEESSFVINFRTEVNRYGKA